MKFRTDFCEISHGLLQSLVGIFEKFRRDFCEVWEGFL